MSKSHLVAALAASLQKAQNPSLESEEDTAAAAAETTPPADDTAPVAPTDDAAPAPAVDDTAPVAPTDEAPAAPAAEPEAPAAPLEAAPAEPAGEPAAPVDAPTEPAAPAVDPAEAPLVEHPPTVGEGDAPGIDDAAAQAAVDAEQVATSAEEPTDTASALPADAAPVPAEDERSAEAVPAADDVNPPAPAADEVPPTPESAEGDPPNDGDAVPVADETRPVDGEASTENLDVLADEVPAVIGDAEMPQPEVPAVIAAPSATDELPQLAESAAELEVEERQVIELSNVSRTLESIEASLESALSSGGLRPDAARMMMVTLESLREQLDITDLPIPSVENFGGFTQRSLATQHSLEGVQELMATAAKTLQELLARVKAALTSFLNRVMDESVKIEKRAETLEASVKALTGAPSKTGFNDAGLARRVAVGTKIDPMNIAPLVTAIEQSLGYDKQVMERLQSDFDKIKSFAATKLGDGDISAAVGSLGFAEIALPGIFNKPVGQGHGTDVFAGNSRFVAEKAATEVTIGSVTVKGTASWKVTKVAEDVTIADTITVNTLSVAQIGALAGEIKTLCGKAKQLKDESAALEKANFGEITAAADLSEEQQKALKSLTDAFQQKVTLAGQSSAKVAGYAVSVCSSFMTWCEKSAQQYGKPAAAGAPAPAAA